MKTKLFTRNLCLGMLMTLVLAFGVHGVVDALTLTKTSGDFESNPAGSTFEITFSVKLESNTTKRYNSDGQQIDEYNQTIDSSGYLVKYIKGKARRFISSNSLSDANTLTSEHTYAVTSLDGSPTLRVRGSNDRSSTSLGARYSLDPSGNLYVSGTSVVDSQDRAVYIETEGTGDDAGEYKYTRAKANPVAPYTSNAPQRYAYNDEQIKITADNVDEDAITMLYRGREYTVTDILDIPSNGGTTPAEGFILSERDRTLGIPSSITLKVKTGDTAGTHTVTIDDNRASGRENDYPNPKPVSPPIVFTLYTTEDAETTESVTAADRFISTTRPTLQINNDYTTTADNRLLSYQVLSGPGTLYVGALDNPTRPATKSLIASKATSVFLYLNRGESRVRVYLDGGHPEDGTTITYDYTGTDRLTGGSGGGGGGGSTISVSPSSLSGAPGDERTITVTPSTASVVGTFGFRSAGGSITGAGSTRIITLPNTPGQSYILTASASGYNNRNITVQVTGTGAGTTQPTLSVTPTRISGAEPGSPRTLTITTSASLAQISVNPSTAFRNAGGIAQSPVASATANTYTSTLILPTTTGDYTVTVNAGTAARQVSIGVGAVQSQTGGIVTVGIQPGSGAPGTTATVTVTATDSNNQPANVSVTLSITAGGGTFANGTTTTIVTTGTTGSTAATLTRGSTPGINYYITASVPAGYTFRSVLSSGERVTISGTTQQQQQQQQETREAGEADAIDVYDGDGQRGTVNVRLAELLVVEVTDANGNPVSGERVTFRTTIGSGRFSPARPRTNGDGRAQTRFTPTSSGTLRIAASVAGVSARAVFRVTTGAPPASLTKVSGDSQSGMAGDALATPFVVEVKDEDGGVIAGIPVTFSVTAGGGSLSATSATTDRNGRAETTLTLGSRAGVNSVRASVSGVDPVTFSTSIEPTIHVAAANRPSIFWIDDGGIYALINENVQRVAPGVDNALNITIGAGKIYWTEKTGESAGTINASRLDGTNVEELKTIQAVPMGIAVDERNRQLYWTNSRGRIQSANLDASGIKNVLQNLPSPGDLALMDGNAYWTQGNGNVRFVNLSGTKNLRNISTGMDAAGSLVIADGKVYWTEMNEAGGGTINAANLDGTGATELASILAAPRGIAVDRGRSKLYWTNARGRVQSANLDGSGIRNVVSGLINPGEIIFADSIQLKTTPTPTPPTTTAGKSKYDINGDGAVDSTDVDVLLLAATAGVTTAKYDVNGDGKVDINDVVAVNTNRDKGAAGAPTLLGRKFSALEVQRLQEQIDLLIATGDRSPAAMQTLVYLQQLIVMARPEKTQLLANFPNPFNPETWMPYELATDTTVKITIYNTQGVVVRTLQLGQQSAGYYTDRERAAYWDGRNAFGEQVASGVYFYQLETDEISSMRKMVILK